MDEEDFSEFGIAPQKINLTEDFGNNANKRKREQPSSGPIPGEPVLKNLLKPVHDKAAVRILKTMGWRENQGVGSRLTFREKKQAVERNRREMYVKAKYHEVEKRKDDDDDDDDMSDEEITFAPDDFDPHIAKIKDNCFGLGYKGLQPSSSSVKSQHVNLFESIQVLDKSNRKFSIRGQGFGTGALEEEDDDIYAGDDMSNYDRTLENEKNDRRRRKNLNKPIDASIIEGFSRATINDYQIKIYPIDVPRDFEPRNWLQRKSRFQPLDNERAKVIETQSKYKVLGLGRHDLKPEQRGALLNEPKKIEEIKELPPPPSCTKTLEEEKARKSEEAKKKIEALLSSKQFVSENSKKNETFKPFLAYPEKQERYEKFIELKSSDEKEIEKLLNDIQPLSMSAFDREREKKEFMQAKRMYQPLDSIMANRFIKEIDVQKEQQVQTKKTDSGKEVVVVQRTKSMWKPNKKLCKLFNIPEPFGGMMFDVEEEDKKNKKKQSLFDYIGVPVNSKANFVNVQVIPRKMTHDNRKQIEEDERRKSFLNAIEKEKSFMNKRAAAKDFFDVEEPTTASSSLSSGDKKKEASKEVKRKEPEAPKTELEIKVAESINKKPEEKKDLFKAIFCDSDDDDDKEEHNQQTVARNDEANNAALSEKQKSTFIESFLSTKNASEINIMRNSSPPRGIFKNIFEMSSSTSQKEHTCTEIDETESTYGPAIPKNIQMPTPSDKKSYDASSQSSSSSSSEESSLNKKLLKKLKKKSSGEKWVEKKDKVKKSKKSKKSHKKSSKKKHKSRK